MAFNFDRFVQKSTRGLFAFITVVMIIPLVMWGYAGGSSNKEEDKSDAGVIYGKIHITKSEYSKRLDLAPASWWWKQYENPYTMMMIRYGQRPKDPTADDLGKQAWEDVVLLREARAEGLSVSEEETLLAMRDIFVRFTGRAEFEHFDEIMPQISDKLLHLPYTRLQAWVADHALIDK